MASLFSFAKIDTVIMNGTLENFLKPILKYGFKKSDIVIESNYYSVNVFIDRTYFRFFYYNRDKILKEINELKPLGIEFGFYLKD